MAFNTSSVWIKVGLICLALGALLFVIGFATTAWMVAKGYYARAEQGLWSNKRCSHNTCHTYDGRGQGARTVVKAFECIGLACQLLALLIMFLFIFVDSLRKRSPLIAVIILCFLAAVCMAIGFIIFAARHDAMSVGWSMGLAIGGCILTFVAGVMAILDLKR